MRGSESVSFPLSASAGSFACSEPTPGSTPILPTPARNLVKNKSLVRDFSSFTISLPLSRVLVKNKSLVRSFSPFTYSVSLPQSSVGNKSHFRVSERTGERSAGLADEKMRPSAALSFSSID